jgi:hypothetical protein
MLAEAKTLLASLRGETDTKTDKPRFGVHSDEENSHYTEGDGTVPENGGNCHCCDGKGEHDTGKECYGCDGTGLDRDYSGPTPCDGTKPEQNNLPRLLARNANITPDQQRQIDLATEQFKQSVQRVDNQLLLMYVQAVQNGSYEEAERILESAQESPQANALMFALLTIGTILLPIYAYQRIQNLLVKFGLHTVFARTDSSQEAIKEQAEKGAKSHVQTIARDLKHSLDDAIDTELTNPEIEAKVKEKYEELAPMDKKEYLTAVTDNEEIYKYARDLILSGETRQSVIKNLQENFAGISKRRANVIAGNESNRVFNTSQFEADAQFLAQNKLTDKAYKRLVSNTGTPEALCKSIIEKTHAKPIPFKQDFIPFGKIFTFKDEAGKVKKFKASYEHLKSGTIHVNCHCRYELLIKQDDGTFLNTFDNKILNEVDFKPLLHPRNADGKFTKKAKSVTIDLSKVTKKSDFDKFVTDAYFEGSLGDHAEDVVNAVRAYQGHYYDAINNHARSMTLDDPLIVYGEETTYGDVIGNVNIAANTILSSDVTLYRGTEIPHHQILDIGGTLNSRSLLSTSIDKRISDKFKFKGGSTLVITAKKGQKVILPDYLTLGKRGRTMGEAEVLIPTGAKLIVTKIEGDIVHADLN